MNWNKSFVYQQCWYWKFICVKIVKRNLISIDLTRGVALLTWRHRGNRLPARSGSTRPRDGLCTVLRWCSHRWLQDLRLGASRGHRRRQRLESEQKLELISLAIQIFDVSIKRLSATEGGRERYWAANFSSIRGEAWACAHSLISLSFFWSSFDYVERAIFIHHSILSPLVRSLPFTVSVLLFLFCSALSLFCQWTEEYGNVAACLWPKARLVFSSAGVRRTLKQVCLAVFLTVAFFRPFGWSADRRTGMQSSFADLSTGWIAYVRKHWDYFAIYTATKRRQWLNESQREAKA